MKPQVAKDLARVTPEIEKLFDVMRANYKAWMAIPTSKDATFQSETKAAIDAEMIGRYSKGLTYEVGGKFIKLIQASEHQRHVVGFVVISDTAKWKSGDLLKSASWNAPAQNFKRGNIFEPATWANTRWTGIM